MAHFTRRQLEKSQEKLTLHNCAEEVVEGHECFHGGLHGSNYFPNELDDLLYFQNFQDSTELDLALYSPFIAKDEFASPSHQSKNVFPDEETNKQFLDFFDNSSSNLTNTDFDDTFSNSWLSQPNPYETFNQTSFSEDSQKCEATKADAGAHLESFPHPQPQVQSDSLEDFINSIDPTFLLDYEPFIATGINLGGDSLLDNACNTTDDFSLVPYVVNVDQALSSSTSSTSLSSMLSLSSSKQPQPPSPVALSEGFQSHVSSLTPSTSSSLLNESAVNSYSSSSSSPSSLVMRPERRERKKEQNKTAALRYRNKKRSEFMGFLQECEEVEKKNSSLKNKVTEIIKEISYLKGLMSEICAIQS